MRPNQNQALHPTFSVKAHKAGSNASQPLRPKRLACPLNAGRHCVGPQGFRRMRFSSHHRFHQRWWYLMVRNHGSLSFMTGLYHPLPHSVPCFAFSEVTTVKSRGKKCCNNPVIRLITGSSCVFNSCETDLALGNFSPRNFSKVLALNKRCKALRV